MRFTWDEKKNIKNIKKHGIKFSTAARVFTDPMRIEKYDVKHSNPFRDERTIAIGIVDNRLLYVNFTEPDSGTVHIISARKADKHERRYYYGNR